MSHRLVKIFLGSQLPSLISLFIFFWSISEAKPKNNWMRGEQAYLIWASGVKGPLSHFVKCDLSINFLSSALICLYLYLSNSQNNWYLFWTVGFFYNTFSACHQRAICCLHSMTQICQIGTDRTCSPEKAKDALNKVSFLSESQEKVENCGHQTENGKLEAATWGHRRRRET